MKGVYSWVFLLGFTSTSTLMIYKYVHDCKGVDPDTKVGGTGYMSTQREVLEGQTGSHRAKRAKFGRGVLPRKISKTYMANGAMYVIPELYL